MDATLSAITDPRTPRAALIQALGRLGPPGEPPRFWSAIANDDRFSPDHRRRAVFELMRRHVRIPVTVEALAGILDRPTWLHEEDVTVIDRLGGKIPVEFTFDDTVLVVGVFPNVGDTRLSRWSIYLRVQGHRTVQDVVHALQGRGDTKGVGTANVLEYALVPPDPSAPDD
jgi:hypothetical protein